MNTGTKILSGQFSSGKDANGRDKQGNFVGRSASTKGIFVNKALLASIGITDDKSFVPFYAITATEEISPRDAEGKIQTDVKTTRVAAVAVFKTQEELVDGMNADLKIVISSKADLQTAAKSSGLTDAVVDAILTASI
jgi:hypothetical protein